MPTSATVKPHPHRSSPSKEISEINRARSESVRRVLKAREEAEAAFDRALASSKSGKNMLQQGRQLASALARASRKLKDGKITRGQINEQFAKTAHAFEKKYRPLAEREWLKVAKHAPTIYEMHHALFRDEKPPLSIDAEILYFLGLIFKGEPQSPPADTGTSQQALMQPIDISATSFDLDFIQQSSDGIGIVMAFTNLPFGGVTVGPVAFAEGNVPGVASDWALVGTKFDFPGGPTTFTVSVDISSNLDLSSYVVFGGAYAAGEVALRIQPSGQDPQISTQPILDVVAPVLWGAEKTLTDTRTITQTLTLDDPASQSLTVLAGAHAHVEVEGSWGASTAIVSSLITKISVHAM
jgi:hypothetical protein